MYNVCICLWCYNFNTADAFPCKIGEFKLKENAVHVFLTLAHHLEFNSLSMQELQWKWTFQKFLDFRRSDYMHAFIYVSYSMFIRSKWFFEFTFRFRLHFNMHGWRVILEFREHLWGHVINYVSYRHQSQNPPTHSKSLNSMRTLHCACIQFTSHLFNPCGVIKNGKTNTYNDSELTLK